MNQGQDQGFVFRPRAAKNQHLSALDELFYAFNGLPCTKPLFHTVKATIASQYRLREACMVPCGLPAWLLLTAKRQAYQGRAIDDVHWVKPPVTLRAVSKGQAVGNLSFQEQAAENRPQVIFHKEHGLGLQLIQEWIELT